MSHRAVEGGGEGEGQKPVLDLALLLRLWPFLRPHRVLFGLSLVLMPLLAGLDLVKPYLLKVVVDEHLVPGRSEGLEWVALAYMGLLLAHAVVSLSYFYLTQRVGQLSLSAVRREVFRKYQAYAMSDLHKNPVGRLMTRATTDVEALIQMFQSGILTIFSDLLTMTGILAMLFYLEWRLASYLLLVLPVAYGLTSWIQRNMRQAFRIARERLSAMNAFVQENIQGIRVVHLFQLQEDHQRRFREINEAYRDAYHRSNLFDASLFSSMEFTGTLCVALFLWGSAYPIAEGTMTLGVLVVFIEYMGRFFAPLRDLSSKFAVMQSAMAAAEKIVQVLDHVPEIRDPEHPRSLPESPRGEIRFRGVDFHYRPDTPVLRGIDLTVRPGEKVAIVGATGAGKSTLIKLLERFYDPVVGSIELDGVDLRELSVRELRSNLAVVLQDVFLVRGTVAENVRLGDQDVSDAAVEEACRLVEADAFVKRLEGGYQAQVQEGATNFSSGERQLLSFARAMVRDPRVLILDEATSSVDVETERRLQRAMERLLENRTSLIIAHRLSTIRSCDRVLVMAQGEIIESGTHAELIDQGGTYSKLYELQEKDLAAPPVPSVRAAG